MAWELSTEAQSPERRGSRPDPFRAQRAVPLPMSTTGVRLADNPVIDCPKWFPFSSSIPESAMAATDPEADGCQRASARYSTGKPIESMYRSPCGPRFSDGPGELHGESVARELPNGCEPVRAGLPTIPTRRDVARERFAWLLEAVTSNG